ncbi:MAG TPA: lamin tail domain-containing protein, partial [Bacillota bacterium]|nr:lamin tail domain-containing protein [Bacillota bacterium]
SLWSYDQTENLDLSNWTATDYNDSLWPSGPGLLAYENNAAITPLIQTPLIDPRSTAYGLLSGHAFYFRTKVLVPTNAMNAVPLLATFRCDDGAVVYINGNEAKRIRMPNGTILNQSTANDFPPFSGSDAAGDEFFSDFSGLTLAPGTNVIAASVHQQNTNSSDLVWGLALDAVINVRLRDTNAPLVTDLYPAPGTMPTLSEIEVHFSEGVLGVTTNALLINGQAATNCTALAPDVYVFDFPQPPKGAVQVAWNPSQPIVDLSANSNRFAGGSYSYVVDPSVLINSMLISEFMAGNTGTVRDDTGQYSDWIELYNSGNQAVNLGGWYLTDNPAKLTKWRFPAGVTLQPKAYLLVWASGLNHTNPAAPLHTSFKLDKGEGNYLGLVYADGTTLVSSFWPYLQQYDDVSYGRDRVDPLLLGYYSTPTPGQPNTTVGPGFGPEVQFSVSSGTFTQPFTLALTTADTNAVIRYFLVTNATAAALTDVPNASCPAYTGPLTISSSTQVRARAFPTRAGYLPGPLHSETYFQLGYGATTFSSDIPIIVFHNMGGGAVAATMDQFM